LRLWFWQSYVRTALVPLIVIEISFLMTFWAALHFSMQYLTERLRPSITAEFEAIVGREASVVAERLQGVAALARVLREQALSALTEPCAPSAAERARYARSPDGALHTTTDDGGAALFYSGIVPIGQEQLRKAYCSARLDSTMRTIVRTHPLAEQVYVNTFDSMNRIYPYIDAAKQYPARMNIPAYNFYYEADAAHNPGRGPVWTELYLDPAGLGWMISVIAPIYRGDFLEGVAGIDVTVRTFLDRVLGLDVPWNGHAMLVGRSGAVLAISEPGQADWQLRTLSSEPNYHPVSAQILQAPEFKLRKQRDAAKLADALDARKTGNIDFTLAGEPRVATWATIAGTDWQLVLVAKEADVFANVHALQRRLVQTGYALGALLVVFYGFFFLYLARKARRSAEFLATPLNQLNEALERVPQGEFHPALAPFPLLELETTREKLLGMGEALHAAQAALLRNQADLQRARLQAEQANQAKSAFLAAASHDLRQPVQSLVLFLNLLKERLTTQPAAALLAHMEQALDAVAMLLNSLLDVSKLDAGLITANPVAMPLAPILDRLEAEYGPRARAAGLRLRLVGSRAVIRSDPVLLERMLRNLLENSLKYTERGSVLLGCRRRGDRLRIEVIDTGIGIARDKLEAVFEEFYQIGNLERDRAKGLGLGLAVVRRLAGLLGYTVEVRSALGRGSAFSVMVPLIGRSAALPPPAAAGDEAGGVVVVVDDDPLVRAGLEAMLTDWGHAVVGAGSLDETMQALDRGVIPRVVLADYRLGAGATGLEAIHAIQERLGRPVPAALMTGDADPELLGQAKRGGFRLLQKPVGPSELRQIVDAMLLENRHAA
jgi:signal transduction histidine kinase/CheY-like chemotaxis protein